MIQQRRTQPPPQPRYLAYRDLLGPITRAEQWRRHGEENQTYGPGSLQKENVVTSCISSSSISDLSGSAGGGGRLGGV